MDARLEHGAQAIQAYYSVLNAADSPVAALRYAALAAVHYLRPLGRAALGLSCGLKGNGMCFSAGVLAQFSWRWFTLAEDVEFHLALVNAGARVEFAPETTVLADMPVTLAQASSQNQRWERGRHGAPASPWLPRFGRGLRRRSPHAAGCARRAADSAAVGADCPGHPVSRRCPSPPAPGWRGGSPWQVCSDRQPTS